MKIVILRIKVIAYIYNNYIIIYLFFTYFIKSNNNNLSIKNNYY